MLIAAVWLMPEIVSVPGANIKLKSRRMIGSVVTPQFHVKEFRTAKMVVPSFDVRIDAAHVDLRRD